VLGSRWEGLLCKGRVSGFGGEVDRGRPNESESENGGVKASASGGERGVAKANEPNPIRTTRRPDESAGRSSYTNSLPCPGI
jgi:hypothetical protein